jgi:hypothetical protein
VKKPFFYNILLLKNMRLLLIVFLSMSLQACAVYSVASSAVSITADVVSTGVSIVTGTVDMAVDAVSPSKK